MIPAPVHSDDEVRAWFASHVVGETELWIAEDPGGELAGILVLDGPWVDQLYVDPTMTGRGIGTALLNLAKREPTGVTTRSVRRTSSMSGAARRLSPFGVYVRRRGETRSRGGHP